MSFISSICFLFPESDSNQKLLMENEKYQELQVDSQRMQEEYEKQLHNLQESKNRTVEELTDYYEEKLNEKSLLLEEVWNLIGSLNCWLFLFPTVMKRFLEEGKLAPFVQFLMCL